MKLSQISLDDIKDYCGVTDTDSDNLLTSMLEGAVSYIFNQTGLTPEQAEKYEDLSVAVMVLVYDMFYNRSVLNGEKVNPIAENILNQHSRNLM